MVRSKSGIIRQTIGPCKGRLQTLITTGQQFQATAKAQVIEANVRKTLIADSENLIARLEASLENIAEQQRIWQELMEGLSDDDVADEEDVYEQFVSQPNNFIEVMGDSKEQIKLLQVMVKRLSGSITATDDDGDHPVLRHAGVSKAASARLPKLTLPEFHGDHLVWSQFWAIFTSTIDESDLRAVEKLTYLRGQLHGVALATIEGLSITDDSYKLAVDILKERFDRPAEQIIGSLYSQLKRMPMSSNKLADLQRTYDNCERIFRQLKTTGEDIDSNRSLVMDVLSKYPPEVLTEISRRSGAIGVHSKVSEVQTAFRNFIDDSSNLAGVLGNLEPFASGKSQQPNVVNSSGYRPEQKQAYRSYDHKASHQSKGASPDRGNHPRQHQPSVQ